MNIHDHFAHADHLVGFFSSDTEHIQTVAGLIRTATDAGETYVIIATPEHREGFRAQLQAFGIDCASLAARYQYIELDARTLLSQFMDGSRCNRQRFHQLFDTLMRQVASRGQPVQAYGEMVNLLVQDGLAEVALELEELWNELSREYRFSLVCGYSAAAVARANGCSRMSDRIRAAHSGVLSVN